MSFSFALKRGSRKESTGRGSSVVFTRTSIRKRGDKNSSIASFFDVFDRKKDQSGKNLLAAPKEKSGMLGSFLSRKSTRQHSTHTLNRTGKFNNLSLDDIEMKSTKDDDFEVVFQEFNTDDYREQFLESQRHTNPISSVPLKKSFSGKPEELTEQLISLDRKEKSRGRSFIKFTRTDSLRTTDVSANTDKQIDTKAKDFDPFADDDFLNEEDIDKVNTPELDTKSSEEKAEKLLQI